MTSSIQFYWARVRDRRARLTEQLAEQHWQPRDGSVFLISVANTERGTTDGVITTVPLVLAAELLEKRTHAVATEEQVAAYRAGVEATRSLARDTEVLNRTRYLLTTKENEQ
jgi:hypothetical protein